MSILNIAPLFTTHSRAQNFDLHHQPHGSRHTQNNGFTLIELMLVIAIISIIAAVALPAYQAYQTRARMSEVMMHLSSSKNMVIESYLASDITQLNNTADAHNASDGITATKYTSTNLIDRNTGEITITTSGNTELDPDARNKTIVLTPQVRTGSGYALLSALPTGPIDWACSSVSDSVASGRGMSVISPGSMPNRFVPGECR
ncbi:MAG: pilin [Pseudomonadales bacterium]